MECFHCRSEIVNSEPKHDTIGTMYPTVCEICYVSKPYHYPIRPNDYRDMILFKSFQVLNEKLSLILTNQKEIHEKLDKLLPEEE